MAGVTTRATKGSPLSATEHDDNLETIINLHKSATEPSPTYACMLWADTATTLLKQRNTADSAWTTLGTLDTAGSFGGGSSDVVDDTTPQLGGNLDMQAHSIEGVDATEIAILDGATVTTAELNILDGVTSTTAELNTLDGITSTVTELNYTDGVTSAIQTQLDAKLSSVADNSVTLAKMAGGTDGNLITYDASGDPAYVTTGTSGQVLTSGGAGVAPTFETAAAGGGITEADQWRLTSSFTGTAAPISTNLSRVNTDGFGKLGTGMSQSSGVFTFPSTGVWEVTFASYFTSDTATSRFVRAKIFTTTDNSTYNEASNGAGHIPNIAGDQDDFSAISTFLFDVTSTTTHKVRFHIELTNSSITTMGDAASNLTYMTFIRLGDT